jgi:hypothetical protein
VIPDFSNRPPGALSPSEMLARAKGRGTRLRRRRHIVAGGVLAALVGAIAGLVLDVAPGPTARQVVISPPVSLTPVGRAAGSCPVSPFTIGRGPAGSPPPTFALASGAYRHLGVGQTVALFAAGGKSITLARGVGFNSFDVSVWAHGPRPLTPVDVLGASSLLYPAGDGTPGARIPFRYPEAGSENDPCQRYQLQAVGVGDYLLITTAENLRSPQQTSPGAVPATTTLPVSPAGQPGVTAEPCQASGLRVSGGRQGESGGAHGDIVITNTGAGACSLEGPPTVEILNPGSGPLVIWPLSNSLPAGIFVLGPGQSASAAVYWSNWCQANPGPLEIAIRLAAGTVTGSFNGPPDYNYVPDCTNPTSSSTLQVIQSYQLGAR